MGEPVEPNTQTPTASPSLPLSINKKTLETGRKEILVLALGILFLASQLCLAIWYFTIPRAAPRKQEQRTLAIILPAGTTPFSTHIDTTNDADSNGDSLLCLRRRSTWGGRSAHPGPSPRGRRKSASSRRKAHDSDDDDEGAPATLSTLSSPGPEPEGGRAMRRATEDMAMAAALATPTTLLPLGPGGGPQDTELEDFDSRRAWGEAGLLAASIVKPSSPRSPRVLAADQAAMMDAFCADEDEEAAVPSPVGLEEDVLALSSGFDDPLGANRRVASPRMDGKDPATGETELQDGGQGGVFV
ncbi:hypothetical protein N8I77_008346 [Diaporthe amygdali]|uniref:Transmembrane protein n=1 Tax=Phomopsis amygdali TaxID=1214568 RepID=A0AAD9W2A9_PHOAM|nr:hypothetical protein N8I77_008346 [Diaporthe amygdali]